MSYEPKSETFICSCSDPTHQLIFQLFDISEEASEDEPPVILQVSGHLNPVDGFFRRAKTAFWYLFGKKSHGEHFHVQNLNPDDVDRLLTILIEFRQAVGVEEEEIEVDTEEQSKEIVRQETKDAIRVTLHHIPASYGIKFHVAEISKTSPFGVIAYSINGEIQKYGIRVDLGKQIFMDGQDDELLSKVLAENKEELFKAFFSKE